MPGALVYELLPSRWRRREPAVSTIGRLDKDTSGLLLFTDDGALLHRVISPRNHVAKCYLATLDRPLRGDEAAMFASGALLLEGENKPLLPAKLEPLSPTRAWLTVTEGRYHQVRRMFAAAGNHVTALHRDRVGGLELPSDFDPGGYRLLGPDEVASIFRQEGSPSDLAASPFAPSPPPPVDWWRTHGHYAHVRRRSSVGPRPANPHCRPAQRRSRGGKCPYPPPQKR